MTTVDHVHEVKEVLHGNIFYPGHPKRKSTPEYEKTHHSLVFIKDTPCFICGIKQSTLTGIKNGTIDPKTNTLGVKFMESHHLFVQDSLADAVDIETLQKIVNDDDNQPLSLIIKDVLKKANIVDHDSLMKFVDSEENMIILCDVHHVGFGGMHNTSFNYFIIQKFILPDYVLFDKGGSPADIASYVSIDDHIEAALLAGKNVVEVDSHV